MSKKHPPNCRHCAAIRGKPVPQEVRDRIANTLRGRSNWWQIGKPLSAETKAKLSAQRRGVHRQEEIGYKAAHMRALVALARERCAINDDSCRGRLEAAFRYDAPKEFVRRSSYGPYYVGVVVTDGYRILCHSHNEREKPSRTGAA